MSEKDSREQLEADVRDAVGSISSYCANRHFIGTTGDTEQLEQYVELFLALLGRQAAITESECAVKLKGQIESCEKGRELYRDTTSALMDSITEGLNKVSEIIDQYDEGLA